MENITRCFENKHIDELSNVSKIHMIGIGGISMSGIAVMLKKSGFTVTGSDAFGSDMVEMLKEEGIDVYIGSNPKLVEGCDIVVYTSAINKENDKEYLHARKLNIPIYERAPFIGKMLKSYKKPISIAGMHGKTTTTSMIASELKHLELSPTVLVGSRLKELNNLNYMLGTNEYFVLEACEYVDSFLNFPGDTSIVLNIEEEHLDYFKNIDNIKKSFGKFLTNTRDNGNVILNSDNSNVLDVYQTVKSTLQSKNIKVFTYSIENNNAFCFAKNIVLDENLCYKFDLYIDNTFIQTVHLSAPGKHNVSNSLAAILVLFIYNIDIKKGLKGLEEFTGASRRFEFKKKILDNVYIYDDYAHHPTEIASTINTAFEKKKNNIIAIFEPHTYSRTKTLFNGFLNAFDKADYVILADIYAARELDDGTISSKMLADALAKKGIKAVYLENYDKIVEYVKSIVKPNDIILTIGAGNITKISNKF